MAKTLMLLVCRRAAGDFGILLNLEVNRMPSKFCVSIKPAIRDAIVGDSGGESELEPIDNGDKE